MIIYTSKITERLLYTLEYIFRDCYGINFTIETDKDKFLEDEGLKLNYSGETIDGIYTIIPEGLLFENTIRNEKPEVGYAHKTIHLYSNDSGDLKFDVFSAVFWYLSRYEEYQIFKPDEHNRYPASESLAFKHGFLKKPLVDEWIKELKESLLFHFNNNIHFKSLSLQVIPTIDIDNPWCYLHKGFLRSMAGIIKDGIQLKTSNIKERFKVLVGKKADTHYNFNWMQENFKNLELKPKFFVLMGKYAKYDKTVKTDLKAFREFVDKIKSFGEVYIHPSYRASTNANIFKSELQKLEQLTETSIKTSRQHFLKIRLPEYYNLLTELGILDDYSMGYADYIGFRAGTSKPFKFFNLLTNTRSNITIHPFSVMDVTLQQYQKLNIQDALIEVKELVENIKNVEGVFMPLWHNESLSESNQWVGWSKMYINMLKSALN